MLNASKPKPTPPVGRSFGVLSYGWNVADWYVVGGGRAAPYRVAFAVNLGRSRRSPPG